MYVFTKFHKFVYATDIIVFTDCKALMGVFASNTKRKLDDKLSPRVTRYVVFMSRYSYQLHHVTSSHNIADFLSRCSYKNLNYCSDEAEEVPEYSEVIMSISDNTTLDIERVKAEILKDDTLRIVKNYVTNGWPEKVNQVESNARPYFRHRRQLSLDREFLWMGTRLVIPVVLQNAVVRLLHETHSSIVAMKRLARRHFYFPNIDGQLEDCVAECISCQEKANMNPKSDLCNWLGPKSPFVRVHVDHFFFGGKAIFLVVDAYSKWVELFIHCTPTTERCISSLELVFTTHGYPETLVSDNHPCFKSFDMEVYCKSRNIKQLFSAPFSPYSNGLAERHVQATKRSLVRMDQRNLQDALYRYLATYRNTVSDVTNQTPSFMVFGREVRSVFDLIKPTTKVLIIVLSTIILSTIILSTIILSTIILSTIILSTIILSTIILSTIIVSFSRG